MRYVGYVMNMLRENYKCVRRPALLIQKACATFLAVNEQRKMRFTARKTQSADELALKTVAPLMIQIILTSPCAYTKLLFVWSRNRVITFTSTISKTQPRCSRYVFSLSFAFHGFTGSLVKFPSLTKNYREMFFPEIFKVDGACCQCFGLLRCLSNESMRLSKATYHLYCILYTERKEIKDMC